MVSSDNPNIHHPNLPGSMNKYVEIPENLILKKLIVFTRHGDRAQISKELGDNYPEDDKVTEHWKSKMLSQNDMLRLASVASSSRYTDVARIDPTTERDVFTELFVGRDAESYPYGMLTASGARQLVSLGQKLRARYDHIHAFNNLFTQKNKQSYIYCRSTSICRTIVSMHSLLYGLLRGSLDDPTIVDTNHFEILPIINLRPKMMETLYPQADGPCAAITNRRDRIFRNNFLPRSFPRYLEFETKMKTILGYRDTVNWLTVQDVLFCHQAHNISYPPGITDEDMRTLSKLNGFTWGSIYENDMLNRIAIGRFIRELIDDITYSDGTILSHHHHHHHHNDNNDNLSEHDSKKNTAPLANILLYSAHDSTLVPLLCAFGIYSDEWPPYATYVAIEIAEFNCPLNPNAAAKGLTTTPIADRKLYDSLWVRLIYNDKERLIDGSGASISTSEGDLRIGGTWCPYEKFINRLRLFSLSRDEYMNICISASKAMDPHSESMKQMLQEINATIGGGGAAAGTSTSIIANAAAGTSTSIIANAAAGTSTSIIANAAAVIDNTNSNDNNNNSNKTSKL